MKRNWIAGKWSKSRGEKIAVINPATEEIIDHVPNGAPEDADCAVAAARAAFKSWRWIPGVEKAMLLHEVARAIRAQQKKLAALMTREGGKPFCENRDEVEWTAACFDYYAEVGRNSRGDSIPPVFAHQVNFTVKEPYGVVVAIVPWNYPLLLLSWKVAPALAAGNAVIIKPSEETPLATLALADAFACLPEGVVNMVTGYGEEIGEALVTHAGTDLVALTGSVETGKRVGQLCASKIKKAHLELGGNDPFIVCSDADLEIATRAACWAAYLNSGQVCTGAKRFYVFEDIADTFTDRVVKLTKSLKLGDGMDPKTDIGPIINLHQLEDIDTRVHSAVARGAKILCGGRRSPKFKKGFFYEPTVMVDITQEMRLVRTETFGPIFPIMRVSGIEEAIRLANDSAYGLGANIYTNNMEWAMKAMDGITAGTFWINDPLTDNDAGPFGGMRQTGHCRELGEEGLDEFRETKHVHLDYKQEIKPYWFPYAKYNKLAP
ncbi:MAG TPA: aldehyde dehydrogenase family protein [Acidobacteriota bacterium]|jgi:betaine-aldehyde dehydrogenase|nr:aldehyde dehydrogenase family protein [Acidobacteriota bacterium]